MTMKLYPYKCLLWLLLCMLSCFPRLSAQVYATTQTNGVTGICLLCGVSDPNNPVNNTNLSDFSTFNITAGLLGVTVQQTLIFPAASVTGCDSLIIGIGSGNALLSVNLLGGITVQTYNGSTANNDVQSITGNILRLLQVSNRGEITLKPQQQFDRVKVTLSSSLLGLLNSFQLYYAYRKSAVPVPVAPDSVALCQGDTAVINATPSPGATIKWYNASSGGTLLATGSSYTVSPAATTTYYAEAASGGCVSPRKSVTVKVNPKPANPMYTVPQGFICGNQVIIISNYTSDVHYNVRVKYYDYLGVTRDTSFSVLNTNTFSVINYSAYSSQPVDVYVQAVNIFGCKSDSVRRSFLFGATAELPTVDADSVTICYDNSTILHGYIPRSNLPTIRWYDAPSGGNLLYSGNYFIVNPRQTTTYYVTAAVPCEFPQRRPVKVIVTKLPSPDYVVPPGYTCGIVHQFPVLNHSAGINYKVRVKYTNSMGQLLQDTSYIVVNKDTITTSMQPQTLLMQGDVYVQAVNPVTNCKSDTVHQVFIIGSSSALPNVDADSIPICRGDSATLHAFVPGTSVPVIKWYDASANGNLLHVGNFYTVSPPATTTYYVTSAYLCDYPQRKPVKVIVNICLTKATSSETLPAGLKIQTLQLYPNPTSGEVRFITDKDLRGGLAIIRDMTGREVRREILQKNGMYLPAMQAGIYFIQVIITPKESYIGKVLVQP
ncbi:MAG TPA: T9SS type A sorting domain-containing protein [Chitinophaga sp.]|uniref:Ig-like domain-containing protein n=1 Tax=Chitinophaga sp. TaxID=1869181 RepID=UPI002C47F7C0|nr:T9SS type A sorting domain-containing protein [Chitinophaga sp.]HVI45050.1 T9SS type A sorting domain-containing protein [Chitinophaga sp.]